MANVLKALLTAVTGLGLSLSLAAVPVLAQTSDGFDDLGGDADSNEVFGGSGLSLTDLMSNVRRSQGLNSDEFSQQSDRNIDEAAADFRQRQQQVIEPGQGAAVETPDFEEQL
ncbi:MAG: hypothetical protein AAGI69_09610 [Cyanobacteria bacterium P01_H01_bin.21]